MLSESNPLTKNERMLELELREIKGITGVIKETYGLDLTELAFASMKRKLERYMETNNIQLADDLSIRIKTDEVFYNQFIKDISIPNTELFRDPSFWRALRTELKYIEGNKLNVWFPTVASGEELYSFCILVKENGWYQDIKIWATDLNDNILNEAKKGIYPQRHHETWASNYERLEFGGNLENHFTRPTPFELKVNPALLDNVTFEKFNIISGAPKKKFDIIIYRNQLIYFNASLQEKVTQTIFNSLKLKGILAVGFKENIQQNKLYSNLSVLSAEEKIFRKVKE